VPIRKPFSLHSQENVAEYKDDNRTENENIDVVSAGGGFSIDKSIKVAVSKKLSNPLNAVSREDSFEKESQ
jgi:hypothetical protein